MGVAGFQMQPAQVALVSGHSGCRFVVGFGGTSVQLSGFLHVALRLRLSAIRGGFAGGGGKLFTGVSYRAVGCLSSLSAAPADGTMTGLHPAFAGGLGGGCVGFGSATVRLLGGVMSGSIGVTFSVAAAPTVFQPRVLVSTGRLAVSSHRPVGVTGSGVFGCPGGVFGGAVDKGRARAGGLF